MTKSSPKPQIRFSINAATTLGCFALCGFSAFYWITPYYSTVQTTSTTAPQVTTQAWQSLFIDAASVVPSNGAEPSVLKLIGTFVSSPNKASTAILTNEAGSITKASLGTTLEDGSVVTEIRPTSIQVMKHQVPSVIHLDRERLFPGKVQTSHQE